MAKIVILGSGGFGLSLAIMAEHCGHDVTVWSKFQSEIDDIRSHGEHVQKLPGVPVSESIAMTSDISCIKGCEVLIFGIPSSFVRDVAKAAAPYVDDNMVIVNTGKGLEEGSLKTLSEVIKEEIHTDKLVVLSGPSHAEELARCVPTTIVAASENHDAAELVQREFGNSYLRIYLNDDVKGCEIGGALKNIIALCVGICDGLGYGDNTKASGVGEILAAEEAAFYDFDAKYNNADSKTIISPNLPEGKEEEIRQDAVKIFNALDGFGLSRVDFFVTKADGRVMFNEINTLPGFTSISMYPKLMEHEGISFEEQEDRLIKLALDRAGVDYE